MPEATPTPSVESPAHDDQRAASQRLADQRKAFNIGAALLAVAGVLFILVISGLPRAVAPGVTPENVPEEQAVAAGIWHLLTAVYLIVMMVVLVGALISLRWCHIIASRPGRDTERSAEQFLELLSGTALFAPSPAAAYLRMSETARRQFGHYRALTQQFNRCREHLRRHYGGRRIRLAPQEARVDPDSTGQSATGSLDLLASLPQRDLTFRLPVSIQLERQQGRWYVDAFTAEPDQWTRVADDETSEKRGSPFRM